MRNFVASLGMLAAVSGCATVVRGTSEKFAIQSEPPGASAVLSTGMTCTTPCTLKLKRKDVFNVTFDKAGYQTAHAEVKTVQRSGAAFGNILAGGVIGAVVDSGNGSLKSLRPNPLKVSLVPAAADGPATVPAPSPTISGGSAGEPVLTTPTPAAPQVGLPSTTVSPTSNGVTLAPTEATPR